MASKPGQANKYPQCFQAGAVPPGANRHVSHLQPAYRAIAKSHIRDHRGQLAGVSRITASGNVASNSQPDHAWTAERVVRARLLAGKVLLVFGVELTMWQAPARNRICY